MYETMLVSCFNERVYFHEITLIAYRDSHDQASSFQADQNERIDLRGREITRSRMWPRHSRVEKSAQELITL
jgi:hypothetical protein